MEVDGGSLLALGFQILEDGLVFPADLVAQTAEGGETTTGLEAQDAQSSRDNHALHLVEGGGDTLENLHALKGSGTTGSLVRDHSADGAPENTGRGAEMAGARLGGVGGGLLAEEGVVLQLGAVEASGHVELFGTDNDNLLSRKNLFSDNGS